MKLIALYGPGGRRQAFTKVDDEWYDTLIDYHWRLTDGYAHHYGTDLAGNKVHLTMHRLVAGATIWDAVVDHADRDPLNNQRSNLRIADRAQNGWNRKLNKNNRTGFKGVTFNNAKRQFEAHIQRRGQQYALGFFETAELASAAYEAAAKRLHGEFATYGACS